MPRFGNSPAISTRMGFSVGTGSAGLGHYEGRGWRGFHYHAALSIAACEFLVSERSPLPPQAHVGMASTRLAAIRLPPAWWVRIRRPERQSRIEATNSRLGYDSSPSASPPRASFRGS